MKLFKIANKSLLNRKTSSLLTILSIALSVCLLLGIERIRTGTRKSFESTISGVDLIVGARSGPVNLMLYSVFRIGDATNNISFQTYEDFKKDQRVDWSIPISLGDSHKAYRVVGTNENYFKHFQFSGKQSLDFSQGKPFQQLYDIVLGSEVAKKLNYKIGDNIILSHGIGAVSFQEHNDKAFKIVGILKPTGTPVDRSLHVSLEAIQAIHIGWESGFPSSNDKEKNISELSPSDITAFFVKLKSKREIFQLQREINTYPQEALMAVLPGVTLRDLWQTIGIAEKALFVVSVLVFFVSLMAMLISLLATLNERRREMAILRSIGAKKSFIFSLLVFEAVLLSLGGIVMGLVFLIIGLKVSQPFLENQMGLQLGLYQVTENDFLYIGLILLSSLLVSILPASKAYQNSVSDGLVVKQ